MTDPSGLLRRGEGRCTMSVAAARWTTLTKLLVLALALVAASAAAQEGKPPDPKVQYERTTVIDFEDDTIQGDLTRPDGEYIDARRKATHANLIKVRESFRDQVLESVGEL